MEYFLESIASSLYKEFGNTLNRHCLVFPNRRAGLFFLKYLAARLDKPVWEPSVLTVSELFRSESVLQTAGNEILLFELYKVYNKLRKSAESFDSFYFWGDMLLNDFDDVDKYLVDASLLFRNVLDIKNIDLQFGGLSESQTEVVRKFWLNFNPEIPTDHKAGFISIWSVLSDLYSEFRSSLRSRNLAYEGMIFRDMAENDKAAILSGGPYDYVHFIGFNALNECEKRVMVRLKKEGKARFYWDYDESFITDSSCGSAGLFMRGNLKHFGNDMPAGWNCRTFLSSGNSAVRRRVIDTSSDIAQVKLVPELLSDLPDINNENAHHTAVVLADENLLIPMLTSLPGDFGDINITMGYPLRQTQVYTLIRGLMDLQRNSKIIDGIAQFAYRDVEGILKNSLISAFISESSGKILAGIREAGILSIRADYFEENNPLRFIFSKPESPSMLSDYFRSILSLIASPGKQTSADGQDAKSNNNILNEFIYRVVLSINRLESICESGEVSFSPDTYMRILDRILRTQSVPFSGEPLSGIQIMGLLETRALDFRNLIVLSVNEGILPSVSSPSSSFIPFSLREAFGLPSVNHQESVYAYHFYRLLQRAEDVTFIYNSNSEGLRSGEMSRFLIQMNYDPLLKPDFVGLNLEIKSHSYVNEIVNRTKEHSQKLSSRYILNNKNKLLSPSAINMWLHCRMKFFYRYVCGLKETPKVRDEIDNALLGTIIHSVMQRIYSSFNMLTVTKGTVEELMNNRDLIDQVITTAINTEMKRTNDPSGSVNEAVVGNVLHAIVLRALAADLVLTPFRILGLEKPVVFSLNIATENGEQEIFTGGIADRIDIKDGVTRIVDYKTGTISDRITSIADLFKDDRAREHDGWLQTLLYCEAYLAEEACLVIRPSVYKMKKRPGENNSDMLVIDKHVLADYMAIRDEFLELLRATIISIFNPEEPFVMTKDRINKCRYCPYRGLCQR